MKKINRGMTMIEIIIAFVLLVLVMGISYSSIRFASNLTKRAAEVDRNNQSFQSAVADYFRDDDNYNIGSSENIEYSFEGVKSDGSKNGPYNFSINTANVTFKRDGGNYVHTTDDTGDNIRKLYIFSTDD